MDTPSKTDSSFFDSPSLETYPILKDPVAPADSPAGYEFPPHFLQHPFYWKWPARIMAFHRNQHGITEVRKALSNFHLVWLFSTSLQASVLAEGWKKSYVLIRWDPKCFAFHRSFSGRTKSSLLVSHLTQFMSGKHPQAMFCLTAHPTQADQYLLTVVAHNLDSSSFQAVMSFSLTDPTLLSLDDLDFSAFVLSPDFDATDYVQSTTMQFVNGFNLSSSRW